MANRRPLVNDAGSFKELPSGDALLAETIAGGIGGGGSLIVRGTTNVAPGTVYVPHLLSVANTSLTVAGVSCSANSSGGELTVWRGSSDVAFFAGETVAINKDLSLGAASFPVITTIYNGASAPSASSDRVKFWAADFAAGDARLYVLGESGTSIVIGGGQVRANQLVSTVSTGTAPLAVSSTTAVANLNADLLDGNHASAFATASNLTSHTGNTSNPHSVTKSQVGLGNVPNTDCTNASNISSGTLALARGGVGFNASSIAKGGLLVGTASGSVGILAAGSNGQQLIADSAETTGLKWGAGNYPSKYRQGLGWFPNSTTGVDIYPGGCRSDADDGDITNNASPLTKLITSTWSAGSGNGGLDAGSVAANSTYYLWMIRNPTTLAVDALFSLSASSPTLPTGYTQKRLIGAVFTQPASTAIRTWWLWNDGRTVVFAPTSQVLDVSTTTLGTTDTTFTLASIPQVPNQGVMARVNAVITNASNATALSVRAPYYGSGAAPSTSAAPLTPLRMQSSGNPAAGELMIYTNASGQIVAQAGHASTTLRMSVVSFEWPWSA